MPRIALYSHDTMGLGHVRRNLLLAEALTSHNPATTALLVSGVHIGAAFRMPPNVDCLTLPALVKDDGDGAYGARHLGVSLTRVAHLRARTTRAALLAFDPDLLVVDNVPRGAMGEVEPALAGLKSRGRTRFVLGLRDVLDDPDVVAREWRRSGHHEAVARYYDQIWVYGDPRVYDVAEECGFPASTADKVEYVGYLNRRMATNGRGHDESQEPLPDRFALCMAGGGQDGSALALAFAQAHCSGLPRVLLGGPFLPDTTRVHVRQLAAADAGLRVMDFSGDTARLIGRADRLVIMGGYNTVCEALAYGKPTLIVPREWPRREQIIRAQRLHALGLVDMLSASQVSPDEVTGWLETPVRVPSISQIRFTGLARVSELVARLLGPAGVSSALVPELGRPLAN